MKQTRNNDMIGEKELLVVSFGTSVHETREKTIGAIENTLEQRFPEYSVRRAFTSNMILRKLAKEQILIDSVEQALERARMNHVHEMIIQPTHMMPGLEYQKLRAIAETYRNYFSVMKIGKPLLANEEDFHRLVSAVTQNTASYANENRAVVFMGHGTEAEANSVYTKLNAMLHAAGYPHHYVGTVEAEPSLADIVEIIGKAGYREVVLEPLMVVAGDHALNDMAGDGEDSWKNVFLREGIQVSCIIRGLGEFENIRDIYCMHVQQTLKNA